MLSIRNAVQWIRKPSPYKSYRDFFEHRYLELHKEPKVLEEHYRGTKTGLISGSTSALATAGTIALTAGATKLLALAVPVFLLVHAAVTYKILLPSHRKYGHNKAATLECLKHALWSIRGDHEMCLYHALGWLPEEFNRLGIKPPEQPVEDEKKD